MVWVALSVSHCQWLQVRNQLIIFTHFTNLNTPWCDWENLNKNSPSPYFVRILYYWPQLYIHSWYNWAYTCPHFRFRRQQTQVVAERGRFPHLASCRQLSAAPLPAQRNIDSILSKTYLSSQLGNVKLPLQRSTPNIHLSCQQDGIIENIPQWEQGLQFTNHHALHCNHYSENRVL